MRTRVLGRTGIEVTTFGLGCAMLGVRMGEVNERTGVEVVSTAMKAGVTLLDVAALYPAVMPGLSERIVGQALKENPELAKKAVVETKVGHLPEGLRLHVRFDDARGRRQPGAAPGRPHSHDLHPRRAQGGFRPGNGQGRHLGSAPQAAVGRCDRTHWHRRRTCRRTTSST